MTFAPYALGYPATTLATLQGFAGNGSTPAQTYLQGSKLRSVSIKQNASGALASVSLTYYGASAADVSPAAETVIVAGSAAAPTRAMFTIPPQATLQSLELLRVDLPSSQGVVASVAGFRARWLGAGGGAYAGLCAVDGWGSRTFGAVSVPPRTTPVGFVARTATAGPHCVGWQWQFGSLPFSVGYTSLERQAEDVPVSTVVVSATSPVFDGTALDPRLDPPPPAATALTPRFEASIPYVDSTSLADSQSGSLVSVPLDPACAALYTQTFSSASQPPFSLLVGVRSESRSGTVSVPATNQQALSPQRKQVADQQNVPLGSALQMQLTALRFAAPVECSASALATFKWDDLRGGVIRRTLPATLAFTITRTYGFARTFLDQTAAALAAP